MREQRKQQRGSEMRRGTGRLASAQAASGQWVAGPWVPLCLLLILMSALSVLQSSHRSRQLFAQLEDMKAQARSLEEDWGRLLLEQSTWASPERVQRLSEGRLHMRAPELETMVTVIADGENS